MRLVISGLLLLATATVAGAATTADSDLQKMIVGSWADTASCKDGSLVFNADGTFISRGPEGAGDDLNGTFTIVNGKLNGKAGDVQMPQVTVSFNADKLMLTDDTDPNSTPDSLVHCQ